MQTNRSRQTSTINSTLVRLTMVLSRFASAHIVMPLAATLAPGWTVRTLAQRFITPPHHPHSEREKRLLAGGTQSRIATPMGEIAAWRFGPLNSPAVVLSHGWGGRGAQFREFVPALIDAGYAVWVFDHISHGFSAGQEAVITDFSNGLTAVVRRAQRRGDTVVGLVGHSLGCAGIGIALRGPLADLQTVRVVQIAPPSSLIRASRFFARAIGMPERIRAAMQWRLEQRIGIPWQSFEMPDAVAAISAPALVIHDANDHEVRIESGLTVARSWPGARFKQTSGLGHRRILRDRAVATTTADFIADRVVFDRPPALDEWNEFRRAMRCPNPSSTGSVSPLY